MSLGFAIKTVRESRGLTIEELGSKTLVKKYALAHIESDHVYPKSYQIKDIAKALEVPVSLLYLLAINPTELQVAGIQVNKLKIAAMTQYNIKFGTGGNIVVNGVTMRRFYGKLERNK